MKRNRAERKHRQVLKSWQKRGLVLCVFSLLISAALQGVRTVRSSTLPDQNEAARWAPGGGYAQVSVFFSEGAQVTQDNLKELAYNIREGLAEDSVGRQEGESGQDCLDAFSTYGSLTIEYEGNTLDVEAVGIGGSFFSFHPLELVTGSYFDGDDLMKDRIIIDEDTAWKLFGSPDVVGQPVLIGDMEHYIAGVYRREEGGFYESAGLDRATVFVAYKTMLQYGTKSTFSQGGSEGAATETEYLSSDQGGYTQAYAQDAYVLPETRDAGPAGMASPSTYAGRDYTADASADAAYAAPGGYEGPGDYEMPGSDGPGSEGPGADYGAVEPGGPGSYFPEEVEEEVEEDTTAGTAADSAAETVLPADADTAGADAAGAADAGQNAADTPSLPEGTGTQNTAFTDSGKVLCYEIVMPDPVDGYAEKLVRSKIGLDTGDYAVVENTGRYGGASLSGSWLRFWTRSMRVGSVAYPFWENAARGWEDIMSLLFLVQSVLTAFPILYALYLILYYFTHKHWTLLGIVRDLQDQAYEREAARRYPELVKQLEAERMALKGEA